MKIIKTIRKYRRDIETLLITVSISAFVIGIATILMSVHNIDIVHNIEVVNSANMKLALENNYTNYVEYNGDFGTTGFHDANTIYTASVSLLLLGIFTIITSFGIILYIALLHNNPILHKK